jgi:hypothetical protein
MPDGGGGSDAPRPRVGRGHPPHEGAVRPPVATHYRRPDRDMAPIHVSHQRRLPPVPATVPCEHWARTPHALFVSIGVLKFL